MHPEDQIADLPRNPSPEPVPAHGRPRRRHVIGALGITAALPVLGACTTADPSSQASEDFSADDSQILPKHSEQQPVTPDIPSVNGSTPGYTTYPSELPQTVSTAPGKGSNFTCMVPSWTSVRADLDNDFSRALNSALGATLSFQMTTGNDYRDKQSAVFASPDDVADWVSVFGWNPPARFDQAVESVFQNLTPFLAGDKISRWKNLANLPEAAWRFGAFKDKLYGIPVPGEVVTDAILYREDLFKAAGVDAPRTADEFLEVGAWTETAKKLATSNPDASIRAMSGISATGTPVRYKGAAANFFSFLKRSEDTARIEELLGIADYLAAPFGTKEWELASFGVEGTHFTRGKDNVPVAEDALAEQHPGVLATLVTGPVAKYDFSHPELVEPYCRWMAEETEHMVEGPFYGFQVVRPAEYATLDQPLYDLEKDVVRGRKSLSDFDQAVKTWRSSGGDRMREYYQAVLDQLEK